MQPEDLDIILTTQHHGLRFSYVIYQSYQSSVQLSRSQEIPQIGDLIHFRGVQQEELYGILATRT